MAQPDERPRITIRVIGPDEELFNRADPHCELCDGLGRFRRQTSPGWKACPCTS